MRYETGLIERYIKKEVSMLGLDDIAYISYIITHRQLKMWQKNSRI